MTWKKSVPAKRHPGARMMMTKFRVLYLSFLFSVISILLLLSAENSWKREPGSSHVCIITSYIYYYLFT